MTRLPLALALLLTTGCSRYVVPIRPEALPERLPPTSRLEVWSRGTARQLHRVTVTTDSLRGIPWWQAPECDSCWVTLARSDIDSVRIAEFDPQGTGALFVAILPFAAYGMLWLILSGVGT